MSAELNVVVGAEIDQLRSGLSGAERLVDNFVSKVEGIGKMGDALSGLGKKLTAGLTLPIVGLGVASIKAFGDIQSLQKGLEAVMGSAGAAQGEFNKLKEVAKLPGLGMEEAVKGSINLQAIGMSADKSRQVLSQFGNAVASVGKGRAEFERAIYGVQQLANTDFPLGEDLNIIKDALPQVSNLLKDAFGSSRSDELAKMGVSSKQVLDTIVTGLEKLPRVSGGIKGAFENMSDSMKTSLGRIGAIIDKNFDISGIVDKITGFVDKAVTAFENLSPTFQKVIIGFGAVVAAAGPLLVAVGGLLTMLPTLVTGIGAVSGALTVMTGPIGLVTAGLIGIVTAVVTNWGKIKPYLDETIDRFKRLYNESTVFRVGLQTIGFTFNALGIIAGGVLKGIWESIKTLGKGALNVFSSMGDVLEGALTGNLGKVEAGFKKGFNAINGTVFGLGGALVNTVKGVGKDLSDAEKYWSGFNFDNFKVTMPNLATDVAKEAEKEISKGIDKAEKKAKTEKKTIELPDLEVVKGLGGKGFMNELGETFSSLEQMDARARELSESVIGSIRNIPISLSESAISITENIIAMRDSFAEMADFGNFLREALTNAFNSVVNVVADSFSAIGESIATGGNVLSAVGNVVIGAVGSFLSTLGKQMIQYGIAAMAMAVLSKMLLNPITAIPAAGAMIAAGAALSMIGGAISGTLKSGSGGGSYSSSSGGGSSSYGSSYSGGGFSGGGEVVFRISGNDLVGVLSRATDRNVRLGG